jgi:hypothetical protein
MSLYKYNKDGTIRRYKKAVIDCSKDKLLTEQSHADEANINKIIARHGMDMIQRVAAMTTPEYLMDDIPTNDFQEAMLIVTKAQQTFEQLPSDTRKKFNNSPAEFIDYIQNPENEESLVTMGLAQRKPEPDQPIQVIVTNPVTEPEQKPTP